MEPRRDGAEGPPGPALPPPGMPPHIPPMGFRPPFPPGPGMPPPPFLGMPPGPPFGPGHPPPPQGPGGPMYPYPPPGARPPGPPGAYPPPHGLPPPLYPPPGAAPPGFPPPAYPPPGYGPPRPPYPGHPGAPPHMRPLPPHAGPPPVYGPPDGGLGPSAHESQRAAEARARQESDVAARRADEERRAEQERKRKVAASWTAHKGPDGQVYYYNTLTEESSWTQPEGFTGSVTEVQDEPVPVSSTPVEGTQWSEVKCEDGRVYYYNAETDETSWGVPDEVADSKRRAAEAEAVRAAEERAQQQAKLAVMRQQVAEQQARQVGRLMTPGPVKAGIFVGTYRQQMAAAQAAAAAARAVAEGVQRFKELLMDKGVTPFSRWEREIPKLETDPRWKLLPSNKERRATFDEFCKNVAEEQKRVAAERAARSRREFSELLTEAVDVECRVLADTRAQAKQDKRAQHEKKEAEEAAHDEDGETQDPSNGNTNGEAEADELIEAVTEADVAGTLTVEYLEKYWGQDERWQAASKALREELIESRFGAARAAAQAAEKARAAVAADSFRALLREARVDHAKDSWSDVRKRIIDDARYESVDSKQRETLFNAYMADLAKMAARAEEEHRMRAEAARRAEAAEREARDRQAKAAAVDALASFRVLLTEVVRDVGEGVPSWRSIHPRLVKDPQGRLRAVGSDREAEDVFRQHINELVDRARNGFKQMITDKLGPLVPGGPATVPRPPPPQSTLPQELTHYTAAEELLGSETAWNKLPIDERRSLWYETVEEMLRGPRPGQAPAAAHHGAAAHAEGGPAPASGPPLVASSGGVPGRVQDPAYLREYGLGGGGSGRSGANAEAGGPRLAPELGASATAAAAAAAARAALPPPPPAAAPDAPAAAGRAGARDGPPPPPGAAGRDGDRGDRRGAYPDRGGSSRDYPDPDRDRGRDDRDRDRGPRDRDLDRDRERAREPDHREGARGIIMSFKEREREREAQARQRGGVGARRSMSPDRRGGREGGYIRRFRSPSRSRSRSPPRRDAAVAARSPRRRSGSPVPRARAARSRSRSPRREDNGSTRGAASPPPRNTTDSTKELSKRSHKDKKKHKKDKDKDRDRSKDRDGGGHGSDENERGKGDKGKGDRRSRSRSLSPGDGGRNGGRDGGRRGSREDGEVEGEVERSPRSKRSRRD